MGAAVSAIAAHATNDTGTGNVVNVWTGVPSTSDAEAVLKLSSAPSGTLRLAVSTDPDMAAGNCTYFDLATVDDATATYASGVVGRASITGLSADTTYYHAIRADDTVYTGNKGKFKTAAAIGAHSFNFTAASCVQVSTDSAACLDKLIATHDPDFFISLGDWPYFVHAQSSATDANISRDRDDLLNQILSFHKSVGVEYIYSDSDYGAASGTYDGRDVSIANTRKRVPLRGLRSAVETDDIAHSWVRGRVRFVACDTRSNATAHASTDSASKTMLGADQKAWFKAQIDAAFAAGQVVVWMVDQPFVGLNGVDDNWPSYMFERQELVEYIKLKGMGSSVMLLAGDMHALAYHSGIDYATGGGASIPVCHAAPIRGAGTAKQGPYTVGAVHQGIGSTTLQYGRFAVTDSGGSSVSVVFGGWRYTPGTDSLSQELADQTVTLNIPAAPAAAAYPTPRQVTHRYGGVLANAASATRQLVLPAPPQAGNLLLLWVVPDKQATVTPPTGFSLVRGHLTGIGASAALYQKTADGTESVLEVGITQTAAGSGDVCVLTEWAGYTVVDQSAVTSQQTAGTTNAVTTGTTTVADEIAIAFWAIDGESGMTGGVSFNNDFTKILTMNDNYLNSVGTSATACAIATKQLSATGTVSVTATHSGANDETVQVVVTLKA